MKDVLRAIGIPFVTDVMVVTVNRPYLTQCIGINHHLQSREVQLGHAIKDVVTIPDGALSPKILTRSQWEKPLKLGDFMKISLNKFVRFIFKR